MSLLRREFLYHLIGMPLALSVCRTSYGRQQEQPTEGAPSVRNYNDGNQYLISEGKTLLINLSFPAPVKQLKGALPVQILPESTDGQQLTEPQPLFFYAAGNNLTYRTILTAPLDVVEGKYKLALTGRDQRGAAQWAINYSVMRGAYNEKSLTVNKNFSQPSPEIRRRMRQDFETMLKIYKASTPRRWREAFISPVPGPDLDNYGDKRTYNETKHSRHAGLDYRARMGTPVLAMNDGTVVLSDEQWVPGQTICLDHGGGIFSKYLHLSERRVRAGDRVRRGQVIALSGKSGGQKPPPHLHLDIVINGVHVDPKDFLRTASSLIALEAQD